MRKISFVLMVTMMAMFLLGCAGSDMNKYHTAVRCLSERAASRRGFKTFGTPARPGSIPSRLAWKCFGQIRCIKWRKICRHHHRLFLIRGPVNILNISWVINCNISPLETIRWRPSVKLKQSLGDIFILIPKPRCSVFGKSLASRALKHPVGFPIAKCRLKSTGSRPRSSINCRVNSPFKRPKSLNGVLFLSSSDKVDLKLNF